MITTITTLIRTLIIFSMTAKSYRGCILLFPSPALKQGIRPSLVNFKTCCFDILNSLETSLAVRILINQNTSFNKTLKLSYSLYNQIVSDIGED